MKIRYMTRRIFGAAAVLVVCSSPAVAGGCGYENCFGAIAAGPNGIAARAAGFRTAPEAWARAERVCRGRCGNIEVFVDGCGAVAQDAQGGTWAGFAEKRRSAMAEAKSICGAQGQGICRIRVWACSK